MIVATASCSECGWSGGPYRSQGQADYAVRRHSCEKRRRRAAAAERGAARRAAVDRTPKPCLHPRTEHLHGTHTCYVLDRCKCEPCSAANSAYEKQRVRQHSYGRWNGLVDAEPVRQHVRALLAAGLGGKQIIRRAGTSGGQYTKLMYGIGDRPPAVRVKSRTAARYLAVPLPASAADLPAGRVISGAGAQRRLQALACIGWSVQALADGIGIDRQRFDGAIRGGDVHADTVAAVQRLYDALWSTPRTATSARERDAIVRTINRARRLGWAPPLAWDDIHAGVLADDAVDEVAALDEIAVDELVAGRACVTGMAERRAAAAILDARGLTALVIAERVGVTPESVLRWRAARRAAA